MAYFDGIEKGDIVWDFNYNWGEVIESCSEVNLIRVKFSICTNVGYNFSGYRKDSTFKNPTLFWDKVNFDIPKKNRNKVNFNRLDFNIDWDHISDKNKKE